MNLADLRKKAECRALPGFDIAHGMVVDRPTVLALIAVAEAAEAWVDQGSWDEQILNALDDLQEATE